MVLVFFFLTTGKSNRRLLEKSDLLLKLERIDLKLRSHCIKVVTGEAICMIVLSDYHSDYRDLTP